MPTKSKKIKETQSKLKFIIYIVTGAIMLMLFAWYGIYESKKLSEIHSQHLTLEQTKNDLSMLYDTFKSNVPHRSIESHQPDNICNEESVKYTSFVCGTRAQLFYTGDELSLADQIKVLDTAIDINAFTITSKSEIKEMSSRDGQSVQYVLKDIRNGQECVINGTYLREKQSIQYHFVCNLTTTHKLYKVENESH